MIDYDLKKCTPRISVIVPVYKVEKYLPECIESVLAQTFTDFELILVDDGSPDNSGKICDDYAIKDSRIRVFHKENGGVSSARRLGFENSLGEWAFFLDADDWIEALCLGKMIHCAETTGADYVVADFYLDFPYRNTRRERVFEDFGIVNRDAFLCYRFKNSDFFIMGRLFRRKILDGVFENLPPSLTFGEDNVMQILTVFNARRFVKLNFKALHYVQRSGSVCNSMRICDLETRSIAVDIVVDLTREYATRNNSLYAPFLNWLAHEVVSLATFRVSVKSKEFLFAEMDKGFRPENLRRGHQILLFLLRKNRRLLCSAFVGLWSVARKQKILIRKILR